MCDEVYKDEARAPGTTREGACAPLFLIASGFLSSEDPTHVVLRQIGTSDRVIPREQIGSHKISKRTLMAEGLINSFNDQQVADLFAYLLSLK